MKPDAGRFLEIAAGHLLGKTARYVDSGYERASLGVLAGMLGSVRGELERGVARRVEENAALRRLFADAAPEVEDAELESRLREAAGGQDGDLTLSALERANAALRALLIDLHVRVEELRSPAARRLEQAIWSELLASTERRQMGLGGA